MHSRRDVIRLALGSAASSAALSAGMVPGVAYAQVRKGVLTVAQSFDPQSLWPNFSTTAENINAGAVIVEPLFWMDQDSGKLQPVLATGYEMIDPRTARITLREGVTFTNGEPMNAEAVVESIKVFADPKQTPAYGRFAQKIEKVESAGTHTVILTLREPYPALDLMLDQIYITPKAYWASVGSAAFGQKPIGTGPFKLKEWVRDDHLTMDRNPGYWGEAPKGIDTVVWKPVPNDMSRAAGQVTGQYDISENLPVASIPQFEGQTQAKLLPVPSYRIFTIILSTLQQDQGPLQDKRVRQALNYAIDKQALLEGLFFGKGQLLQGQLLRREQLGFDPTLTDYPFDLAKARKLMADAGYASGFTLNFKFPTGRYAQDREVASAVAGMLAKIGVKTNMISLEAGEYLNQLSGRQLGPMALTGLAPANDPDLQMAQYRSDWRYSYVQNAEMDRLIDAGATEMDPAKRAVIYRQLSALVREEAPVIFLYQGTDFWATSSRVSGFNPRGDAHTRLAGVSMS